MPHLKITLVFLLMKYFCHRVTIPVQEALDSTLPSLGAGLRGTCLEGAVLDVHGGKAVTSKEPNLLIPKTV